MNVERIHLFAEVRGHINGFAQGVPSLDGGVPTCVPKIQLERVVSRVPCRLLPRHRSVVRTERSSGTVDRLAVLPDEDAVLREWAARGAARRHLIGLTDAEAEGSITGFAWRMPRIVCPRLPT